MIFESLNICNRVESVYTEQILALQHKRNFAYIERSSLQYIKFRERERGFVTGWLMLWLSIVARIRASARCRSHAKSSSICSKSTCDKVVVNKKHMLKLYLTKGEQTIQKRKTNPSAFKRIIMIQLFLEFTCQSLICFHLPCLSFRAIVIII